MKFSLASAFFILLLLAARPATAQRFSLEASAYRGAVWRHTPKLTTRTGESLWAGELTFRIQTLGDKPWHVWHRYPVFGLSTAYFHLGEGSHGDAWGLLPNLTVPIVRRPGWSIGFRVGTGLAWITRPYDFSNNPGQNAIGSHWNNFTQFRLGGEATIAPHWRLLAGASLSHFSNGSGALPNFGVNLPGGFVSLAWQPRTLVFRDFQPAESRRAQRRFGAQLQAGLARVEYAVFDGPKYPVWVFSGAAHFHLNRTNRLLLGGELERNEAVFRWAWHVGNFPSRADARTAARRTAVFLADEFLFGALGIQLQAGYYLGSPANRFTLAPWYSKLTTRFYFPAIAKTRLQPQVGVSLKAHKAVAEYISFNAGFAF